MDGPKKYRKKPVVVEAVCWDGWDIDRVLDFMADETDQPAWNPDTGRLGIPTFEGIMTAMPGDWIVKGVEGEFYPVKPSIFEATYEVAE